MYLQKANSFTGVDADSAKYWVDIELKMNPKSADGFFYRSIDKLAAHETDAFIRDLDSAIMFYDEKVTVIPLYSFYTWRAGAYKDLCNADNNPDTAEMVIADYEQAAKHAKKMGNKEVLCDILCKKGNFCMSIGRFVDARDAFKRALKVNKKEKSAMAGYGISFIGDKGKESEGIRILDECIALYPDYAQAYLNRMILYEGMDVHKAIDDVIMYAKYTEDWPLNYAVLMTLTDDMKYSIECCKREMDAAETDDEKWFWVGVVEEAARVYKEQYPEEEI